MKMVLQCSKILILLIWISYITKLRAQEVFDCTNDDIVTSVFNTPIDLTFNGTIQMYKNIVINNILTTTNNEFEKNYIDARLELNATNGSKNLIIFTTSEFSKYALEQSAVRLTLKITFGCDSGRERTLVFFQPIRESNYFRPQFSQNVYEIVMPTPIFAGFDLTTFTLISARDDDLTNNEITFHSEDTALHYITVGTKNYTQNENKVYFANIILERIYLALANEISFEIIATDNGSPPKNSTAKVFIRADANNSLPAIPQFEQSLYHAMLNRNLLLVEPLEIMLEAETYSSAVSFSLAGVDQHLFSFNKTNNIVRIFVSDTLRKEDIKGRNHLQIELKAENVNLNDYGKTAVIVELPSIRENFHWHKTVYEGSIDEAGLLQIENIVFEPYAYSDDIIFQLNSTASEFFTLEQNANIFIMNLTSDFILEQWRNESFISLHIHANLEEFADTATIFIKLPRQEIILSDKQPVFEKLLYKGRLSESFELQMDTIVLLIETYEPNKTEFILIGDDRDIFDIFNMENFVQLALKRTPTTAELHEYSMIFLTLTARNNKLEAYTNIAIEINRSTKLSEEKIFDRVWTKGYIEMDESNGTQILRLDEISLQSNKTVNEYVFMLTGDESAHFSVVVSVQNKVVIEMMRPLEESVINKQVQLFLELNAAKLTNTIINDKALIFIKLPHKECSTMAPTTFVPEFQSSEYVFAAKPDQLGFFGQVGATIQDSNATLRYSLNVENVHLKTRITINTNNGELMLLSYVSPGMYDFFIIAENTETFSRANVSAHLEVDIKLPCDEQDQSQPTVQNALIIKYIEEEKEHNDVMNMTIGNCHYEIIDMYPNDKPYVYVNGTTKMLSTIAIDREHAIFMNMSQAQIQLKLKLFCTNQNEIIALNRTQRAAQENIYSLHIFDDIPFTRDITILHLIIVDVNDNAPVFEYPRRRAYLGYPDSKISFELFPQYLVKVKAIDKDVGINGKIRYSLSPNKHFGIDPKCGIIYPKANALKTEQSTEFVVLATDLEGSSEGLTTGVIIIVRKLSQEYFTLLTFTGNEGIILEERLLELNNKTGFVISMIKSATIPENVKSSSGSRIFRQITTDNDTVVQKAWIYAFDIGNQPVNCEEFQDKVLKLPAGPELVTVESYAEIGLSSNQSSTADAVQYSDADITIYIVTIGILAAVSTVCISLLIWRVYLHKLFCTTETVSDCIPPTPNPDYSNGNLYTQQNAACHKDTGTVATHTGSYSITKDSNDACSPCKMYVISSPENNENSIENVCERI